MAWEVLNEAAEELQQRQDWAGAEPLWRAMRKGFPHIWYGYTGGATALCGLGRTEEALQVLTQGAHRFPAEYTIRHDLGRLAMRQCDWKTAEGHWRIAIGFPIRPWAYTELARSLEQQGRMTEAEAILLEGQIEEPDELSLYTHYARMVWKREDWAAAVDNLAIAHQRFPTSDELSSDMMQALMRLAEHDPVAADIAHRAFTLQSEAAAKSDKRTLMMQFESLGGLGPDGGCEFGGVQRKHAAEPLGLFRWASVSPESLIACLEGRFKGIGDAETTTIYLHEDDPDELWQIGDKTYGTAMHSFVPAREVPHDEMALGAQRRQRFLRDKLIADLEKPEKIFVLKVGFRQLSAAEVEALSRAMASYGKGELFCVCPAYPKHPHGRIEAVAPNVYIGYIDFSGRLDIVQRHAVWEAMCQTMLDMSTLSPTRVGPVV